jgi:hypothetical protein
MFSPLLLVVSIYLSHTDYTNSFSIVLFSKTEPEAFTYSSFVVEVLKLVQIGQI